MDARDWDADQINLLDYWHVLARRRSLILGLVCVSVFTSGVLCYVFATRIYESKVAILPPKESVSGGTGLAALLTGSGPGQLFGGLISTGGSNRDTFVAILKSRVVAEEIVDRFKLREYYNKRHKEQAVGALHSATDIGVTKEGVITLAVEDRDPKLAAEMANAYVALLDRLSIRMGTSEATRQRAFLAGRLEGVEKALRQAEDSLRRFQDRHRAVVLTEQTRGAIEAAAKVRAEITAAEVHLETMRAYTTEANPNVIEQRSRIQELKRQLAQMQYANIPLPAESGDRGAVRQEMHVPVANVPEVQTELLRLTRDVKVQESLFALLTQQYEQAKIQEAKDTPVVQVLDPAVPAAIRSKPKTALSMAVTAGLALCLGIFLAFLLEYLERLDRRLKQARAEAL
jgi:uncharacterized protein involved in exopolysaccharide biosynthesis